MKNKTLKSWFYCLLFISFPCTAQFADNFSDGDFRIAPIWVGDTTHFEINAQQQLHLNAPAVTGKSYLVTPSDVATGAFWKFWVQLDFNPSSSNYAKIYLMSDKAKLDSALNGYYLRIGGTDDDISLFRQDGTVSKLLIDGRNGMLNSSYNKLSVSITRSFQGEWALKCDSAGLGNFKDLGLAKDTIYNSSRYFGLQCIYTSTRSNKFLFDNFEIMGKRSADTIPPSIIEVYAAEDSLVVIRFSEEVDRVVSPANFNLPQGFAVGRLLFSDAKTLMLYLTSPIPCSPKLEFSIASIKDMVANEMPAANCSVSYCPGNAYDMVITEIMADPDPPVALPNVEYLEILNRSGVTLNLEKWQLQIGSSKFVFPSIQISAGGYLVVCSSKGCNQFGKPLNCLEILPSGTLNNSGEYIGLRNKKGNLIYWVSYTDSFYGDELKKSGGWSLEMVDVDSPCLEQGNWKASVAPEGGTPGNANSVAGAAGGSAIFQYINFSPPNDSTIRLNFSRSVKVENVNNTLFNLDQGLGHPLRIKADSLRNLYLDLVYGARFSPTVLFNLEVSQDLTDCSGNKLVVSPVVNFMKPQTPVAGDIIINEVLFDVLPGEQEFIELYNKSDKFISSAGLKIAYGATTSYSAAFTLGEQPFVIAPRFFVVAMKNVDRSTEAVSLDFVPCSTFPTLNNAEGCIALMDHQLQKLDEFCYSEKMHFSMLVNKSGVSLERMRYDGLSHDPSNWHSASYADGYSTPGKQNSQYLESQETDKEITLEYEIFSPDNDGYKDVETLFYTLDKPGYVANIVIFDAMGRRVRILANNKTLGTSGSFVWDGNDENGRLAKTGIYLVFAELHHPSGEVKQYKKVCVLGGIMGK